MSEFIFNEEQKEVLLGPMSFNIFISNLEEDIKLLLTVFAKVSRGDSQS